MMRNAKNEITRFMLTEIQINAQKHLIKAMATWRCQNRGWLKGMEKDDKFRADMENSDKLGNQMKDHHRGQGIMEIWNEHVGDYKRQDHASREEDLM